MPRNDRPLLAGLLVGAMVLASSLPAATAPAATAGPTATRSAANEGRRAPGRGSASEPDPLARPSEERSARLERYRKWVRDWRSRRDIHKKARLKRLRYRLERVLHSQPVTEAIRGEIERHARTMARLNRIKEVAIAEEDIQAIGKVEAVARRENARHDRWLRDQQREPTSADRGAGASGGDR